MKILETFCSNWKWVRRLSGGHWERWFIDFPVVSFVWMKNEHGKTPPLGKSVPECEDW